MVAVYFFIPRCSGDGTELQGASRRHGKRGLCSGKKQKILPSAVGMSLDSCLHLGTGWVGASSPLGINYPRKRNKSVQFGDAVPAPLPLKVLQWLF